MNHSNFSFLEEEFPFLFNLGTTAEYNLHTDPAVTLIKMRQFVEQLSQLLFDEHGLDLPEKNTIHNRLKVLQFRGFLPDLIKDRLFVMKNKGNLATHGNNGTIEEATGMLFSCFKVSKWFYQVYSFKQIDIDNIKFKKPDNLDARHALSILAEEHEKLKKEFEKLLKERKPEIPSEERTATIKNRSDKAIRKMEMTEAETRDLIDEQLRRAGWEANTHELNFKTKKTRPQKGRNLAIAEWKCGNLWADYALFIGFQLVGIIEAKKHIKNVMADLLQSKNYSKAVLEENQAQLVNHPNQENYKVPFLFSSNGRPYLEQLKTASGIWFWDARDQRNLSKALRDWFSPTDLKEKLAFDEKQGAEKLNATPYDILTDPKGLSLRPYQVEAIQAVEDKILHHPEEQKALLAMATGTGKTRTMIGLCYRLIASGRFRRILFLVDRRMLGQQAVDAFKEVKIEGLQTFAQIYDLQELKQKAAELDTKIHFATVQSMVKRIAYSETPPSVGDYDCIVVDEAHRGYIMDQDMDEEEIILRDQLDFQSKYRMVLDHFDAYRIGLTATPAIHTADIFGHPVYTYSYPRAVIEGYLIDFEPPIVFQTKLSKEGIVWEEGDPVKIYDPEDNEIKDAGVTEDEIRVEIQGFNKRVIVDSFNRTILNELITNPNYAIHPEDNKKTLIFAATNDHADMIVQILKEEFEKLDAVDDDAIVKITGTVHKREELLKKYKNELYPSIVVTVDLLTTGIDVPSICNLVFLRRVNSRILYDQMIGRATRRCDDIGKEVFKVYDCVGVSEIMAKEKVMKPVAPSVTKSFADLSEEIGIIQEEYAQQAKLDRIIAKLQRKLRTFDEEQMETFQMHSGERSITDLALKLKATEPNQLKGTFENLNSLWKFLDKEKGKRIGYGTLYTERPDELQETSRAYAKNLKPKDYLESFTDFIKNNMNEVAALKLVCTKPANLTRNHLKEIRLFLNDKGFSKTQLNTAHKDVTNEGIAADIIAHIRRAALGNALIAHDERIRNAVNRLKESRSWNPIQLKWLDKIEAQLLKESVITMEDLDKHPFRRDGGIKRLNKIFRNETENIISELNQYLYA